MKEANIGAALYYKPGYGLDIIKGSDTGPGKI